MNRIENTVQALSEAGQKAFVAFLTAGDPNLEASAHYCRLLAAAGAHIIELGVPFSDPIADGPTNQQASERALASGTNLRKILQMTKRLRAEGFTTPLLLYSYANPLFKMGFATLAQEAAASGIDGVLCVDMPPEEAEACAATFTDANLAPIFLASPTTDEARLATINAMSRGFVYYVSRAGVTGVQDSLARDLAKDVARVKRHVHKPLFVGFGINTAAQVRDVARLADGVVVGSAIVQRIASYHAKGATEISAEQTSALQNYVASLVAGLSG